MRSTESSKYIKLVLLVWFLLAQNVICQRQIFTFKQLAGKDGLSNSNVNSVIQDSIGFMWFGTSEGLNRFDGSEIKVYRNAPKDSLSLCNNNVESVYEDSNGRLWICTTNGLSLFNRHQNNFTSFQSDPNNNHSLSNNYVRQVLEDDGLLWVATLGGGINLLNLKTHNFKHYRHNPDNRNSISHDWVWVMFKDSRNDLWFGTMGEGLNRLDRSTGTFERYQFSEGDAALNIIRCIYEVSESEFLLGTNGGLVRFNITNGAFHVYEPDTDNPNSISGGHVRDIFKDSSGKLWVASQYGLNIYNEAEDRFIRISDNFTSKNSLSSEEVWDIGEDNQGTLWFATFNGGVNYTNLNQNQLKYWNYDPYDPNGLSDRSVLAFEENADGTLWIGYDRGGFSLFDRERGTLKTYKNDQDDTNSLSSNNVLSLELDGNGQLWSGTWGGGLNKLNQQGQITRYVAPGYYYKQWHIWDILEDSKERIWMASFTDVNRLDVKSNIFKAYQKKIGNLDSISYNSAYHIYECSDSSIWVGTTSGLNSYNEKSDDFTFYPYRTMDGIKLNSYTVYMVVEDDFDRIWIATSEHGLNRLNKDSGNFMACTTKEGLSSNAIYTVQNDQKGNLWLSTSMGLSKVSFNKEGEIQSILNLDTSFKIGNSNFNVGASFESSTGELFFGCNNGFIYFNPDSIQSNNHKPKVVFTGFQIFNEEVQVSSSKLGKATLKQDITQTDYIELHHNQSIFTIKYAALSYISSDKNTYAYMLEGLEEDWNYVNNKRYATYTNLDPGEYIFKVKAANNEGVWSEKEARMTIVIIPPYWKTWWFRLVFILLIVSLVYLLFKLRLKYLQDHKALLVRKVKERTGELNVLNSRLESQFGEIKDQKEELEKHKYHLEELVSERTSELEKAKFKAEESDRLKTSFLSNMSHEIRTPLNSIVGFSTLLRTPDLSINERDDFVQIINSSSETLLQLVDDILDLSLIESNQLKVNIQKVDINKELNLIYQTLKTNMESEKIKFYFENNVEKENLIILSDIHRIKQILVNFINNAFKYTSEGYVKFNVAKEGSYLIFSVIDTGIGIAQENLDIIFERFRKIEEDNTKLYRGTGLGLAICKYISDMLGGSIGVESTFGEGSVFYFSLPISKILTPSASDYY